MAAQAKAAADYAKAVAPAEIRGQYMTQVEAIRASAEMKTKQAEIDSSWQKMFQEQQFKIQNMATEQKNMMTRIWAEGNKQIEVDRARIIAAANNPNEVMKSSDESANKWSEINNRVETQIATLTSQLTTPGISSDQAAQIQEQIRMLKGFDRIGDDGKPEHVPGVLDIQREQANHSAKYWQAKKEVLGLDTGGSNGAGAGANSNPSNTGTPSNPAAAINAWQGSAYLDSALPGKAQ